MKLHHIGYLVKNIEKSIRAFQALGYMPFSLLGREGSIVYDAGRQCDIVFLKHIKSLRENYIELIEPKTKESPIYSLMKIYKNTPYHLCFQCADLDAEIETLKDFGWTVFHIPEPAPAIGGRMVVFLVHHCAGIIELVGGTGKFYA